jgi:hypothetical protein
MKFTQPSEATNAFHSSEMMRKNMVETLTWVVDKFDACLDHREISLFLAKDEIRKDSLRPFPEVSVQKDEILERYQIESSFGLG